jgi:hypothetical protein
MTIKQKLFNKLVELFSIYDLSFLFLETRLYSSIHAKFNFSILSQYFSLESEKIAMIKDPILIVTSAKGITVFKTFKG